jgi:hypothetical protein
MFRPELLEIGELRQVPLRTLDYAAICGWILVLFTGCGGISDMYSDPWNRSCTVSFSFWLLKSLKLRLLYST